LVNLFVQFLCFQVYSGPLSLYPALAVGTLAGLGVKYVLDKKWIFYHTTQNSRDEARKFILYSCLGVATTAIFWGTEIIFDLFVAGPAAKYLGGGIGLIIGYLVKYRLDKRFVFIHHQKEAVT
jgi:putative flippase GtrA